MKNSVPPLPRSIDNPYMDNPSMIFQKIPLPYKDWGQGGHIVLEILQALEAGKLLKMQLKFLKIGKKELIFIMYFISPLNDSITIEYAEIYVKLTKMCL